MVHPVYVQAAAQVSVQQPLSEAWMEQPLMPTGELALSQNPVFADYLPVRDVRRMAGVMRRALVTALSVLRTTGTSHPDAIVTGTSFGCLDYTERFLAAMVANGEQTLSPTHFMQSTHNTVGSALAIFTRSKGYNTTYSHGACSFEQALRDAWMQLQLGRIGNALVGGYDEMVESYYQLLRAAGYVGHEGQVPCTETAVSVMLGREPGPGALCQLAAHSVGTLPADSVATGGGHAPLPGDGLIDDAVMQLLGGAGLAVEDLTEVVVGTNGYAANDRQYRQALAGVLSRTPQWAYKPLFGENPTVSALGFYAAAHRLSRHGGAALLLHITLSGQYALTLLKAL